MGVNGGHVKKNIKLSQRLDIRRSWLDLEGFEAPGEGHIGFILLVPLP